jgi:hypothetical protein
MSIIKLYDQEVSNELGSFLHQIKPNVDGYVAAKSAAQKERMMIIGQIAEYRQQFPQRSGDHRLLSQAMKSEWSDDVIKSNTVAYQEHKRLIETNVPEYIELAEVANPSQLMVLGRGEGTTLAYDAVKHLKQTGSLPSTQTMRQVLSGHKNNLAEKCNVTPLNQQSPSKLEPAPYVAPKVDPDEQEFRRMGVMDINQRSFLRSLVKNENLEHITTLRAAHLWQQLSDEDLLLVLKQKLQVSSSYEARIRGLLSEHTNEVVVDTTATTVTSYDTSGLVSPRWRR